MQVILLKKVRRLGDLGDEVKVRAGYGRNYLIPQGVAVSATPENISKFQARRAELEKAAKEAVAAAQKRADTMADLVIKLAVKAGDEGKLFGSIGTRDIADAISKAGHPVAKSEIIMPQGSIRHIGEHEIFAQLHSDVRVVVKINVTPED